MFQVLHGSAPITVWPGRLNLFVDVAEFYEFTKHSRTPIRGELHRVKWAVAPRVVEKNSIQSLGTVRQCIYVCIFHRGNTSYLYMRFHRYSVFVIALYNEHFILCIDIIIFSIEYGTEGLTCLHRSHFPLPST